MHRTSAESVHHSSDTHHRSRIADKLHGGGGARSHCWQSTKIQAWIVVVIVGQQSIAVDGSARGRGHTGAASSCRPSAVGQVEDQYSQYD